MQRNINTIYLVENKETEAFLGANPKFLFNKNNKLNFESWYGPEVQLTRYLFNVINLADSYIIGYLDESWNFLCNYTDNAHITWLVYYKRY